MRMRCVPMRQFAGEVGRHGARAASGESHVVDDALPFAIRTESFDVRRDGLQPGLIGGVHAGGGEVFDFAVHQKPERAAAIRFAEIEFQAVQLGEAREREQIEVAEVAMREQIGQNVVPVFIVRGCWRMQRRSLAITLNSGYGGLLAKYSLG